MIAHARVYIDQSLLWYAKRKHVKHRIYFDKNIFRGFQTLFDIILLLGISCSFFILSFFHPLPDHFYFMKRNVLLVVETKSSAF